MNKPERMTPIAETLAATIHKLNAADLPPATIEMARRLLLDVV
jgi:hypothetical protein